MSYVIQNFYFENAVVEFVPKVKLFFFFKNARVFYFFFSQNFFLFFLRKKINNASSYKYPFLKFFFFNQIFRIFKKITVSSLSFLDNKLSRSFVFWFFNFLIYDLIFFKQGNNVFGSPNFYLFNNYLLAFKFLHTTCSGFLYKNIFFNLLLNNAFFFLTNTLHIEYPSALFFLTCEVSYHPFYGGYFFNVYRI